MEILPESSYPENHKTPPFPGSVVTMGNFDGCHRGHQKLLQATLDLGRRLAVPTIVLSFNPHPKDYFLQKNHPKIFSPEQKARAFSEMGLDFYLPLRFGPPLATIDAFDFHRDFLTKILGAKGICVGAQFLFGHKKKGTVENLRNWCHRESQIFEGVPLEEGVSSTGIREALGKPWIQGSPLGRPYLLEGILKKDPQTYGFYLTDPQSILPYPGLYRGLYLENPAPPILNPPPDRGHPCLFRAFSSPGSKNGDVLFLNESQKPSDRSRGGVYLIESA